MIRIVFISAKRSELLKDAGLIDPGSENNGVFLCKLAELKDGHLIQFITSHFVFLLWV